MNSPDFLEKAKKIKWHFFNQRKRTPFFNWILIEILSTKKIPLTDLDNNSATWITIDGWNICPEERFQELRNWLLNALDKDPKLQLKIIDAYKKRHDQSLKLWQEIKSKNWQKKSNQELAEALEKFVASRQVIDPWMNLPLFIETDLEEKLKKALKKIFPNDDQAYAVLTSPIYPSTQSQEVKERAQIKTQKELKEHWLKYRWLSDTLMHLVYLPIEHFRKKEAMESDFKENFDKYYEQIKDGSVRTLIDTIQKSIWFRNFRMESFYHSSYLILNLLEAIAKRFAISAQDLVYLTPPEIIDLLKKDKKPNLSETKKRKYGFLFFVEPGRFDIYSGHEVDKWIETLKPGYQPAFGKNKLTGQTAFGGVLTGKVVIISHVTELPKLLKKEYKGAILVTHGTNPQYVPFLKSITAIVTDEGGVLCHAAIISREMKIPCIIGTKVATKVLKDGDLIEVDANKGLVKIIKKI